MFNIKEVMALSAGILIFLLVTGAAQADSHSAVKVDGYVKHHYKTVTTQQQTNNRQCQEVDIPIYGNDGGEVTIQQLFGAIIGGVVGSNVGKGNGKTIATATGAVIGSQIGKNNATKKNIIGYKRQTVCEDNPTYNNVTTLVYSHSTIRFADGSAQYDIRFKKQ
jgi:outer membrane lipoprotein SlyB